MPTHKIPKIEIVYSADKDASAYIMEPSKYSTNIDNLVAKFLSKEEFLVLKDPEVPVTEKQVVIRTHLKSHYKENTNSFKKAKKFLGKLVTENIKNIIVELENLYKTDIGTAKITIYLTTFPRSPYNYKEKWFMVNVFDVKNAGLDTIKHELNHLFFHKKFEKEKRKIRYERFHDIKEAFTVLTLPEELGYPPHYKLRREIKKWKGKEITIQNIFHRAVLFLP